MVVILTYILNEKEYIKGLLCTYEKPAELSVSYLTTLLSKFFVGEYDSVDRLISKVKEELLKFNISGYQEYQYANKIYDICKNIILDESKRTFRETEYVPVYQSDIQMIDKMPSDKYKKILFTLIVNARYMNSDGWINKKTTDGIRDIFKQANIAGGSDYRDDILYELYKAGYISFARSNMNQNIKINFYEHDDEIAYKVTDFKHLGNQYIGNFKKGYMMCKQCGKIIKITGNKKMYCKKCAEIVNREQTVERMRILRENN